MQAVEVVTQWQVLSGMLLLQHPVGARGGDAVQVAYGVDADGSQARGDGGADVAGAVQGLCVAVHGCSAFCRLARNCASVSFGVSAASVA